MLEPMPSNVLEAIAEPTRRRILDAVRDGERSVGDLVEIVGMHQPGVSRHLKVLRDAGLVEVRPDAQRRMYRLRPEPLLRTATARARREPASTTSFLARVTPV